MILINGTYLTKMKKWFVKNFTFVEGIHWRSSRRNVFEIGMVWPTQKRPANKVTKDFRRVLIFGRVVIFEYFYHHQRSSRPFMDYLFRSQRSKCEKRKKSSPLSYWFVVHRFDKIPSWVLFRLSLHTHSFDYHRLFSKWAESEHGFWFVSGSQYRPWERKKEL